MELEKYETVRRQTEDTLRIFWRYYNLLQELGMRKNFQCCGSNRWFKKKGSEKFFLFGRLSNLRRRKLEEFRGIFDSCWGTSRTDFAELLLAQCSSIWSHKTNSMHSSTNICALGYGNPTKVARSNQQKRTYTTCSKGMFLLIAACHLSRIFVAQGTYDVWAPAPVDHLQFWSQTYFQYPKVDQ